MTECFVFAQCSSSLELILFLQRHHFPAQVNATSSSKRFAHMGHSRNPSAASCISFASFISEPISELNEGNEHFDALCDERRFLSNTNACAHVWGRNVFCILSVMIAILTFYFLSNFPLACSVDRTTSATNGCTPKVLGPLWRLHAAQRFSAEPIGVQPLLVLGLAVGCRFKSAKMKLSS